MLRVKVTELNYDYGISNTTIYEYKDWEEVEQHFHKEYVKKLKTRGYFSIHYRMHGDPSNPKSWNGHRKYELVK